MDRIARGVKGFANISHELEQHNVSVRMLIEDFDTSTPMGKAMLHVSAVFAEMEVDIVKEGTMPGKHQNAQQGGYNGSGKVFQIIVGGGLLIVTSPASLLKSFRWLTNIIIAGIMNNSTKLMPLSDNTQWSAYCVNNRANPAKPNKIAEKRNLMIHS